MMSPGMRSPPRGSMMSPGMRSPGMYSPGMRSPGSLYSPRMSMAPGQGVFDEQRKNVSRKEILKKGDLAGHKTLSSDARNALEQEAKNQQGGFLGRRKTKKK